MSRHPEVLWAQRSSVTIPDKVRLPPRPLFQLLIIDLVEHRLLDCQSP